MSKVVVVTGSSKGIGLQVTRILLDAGHCVFGSGRSPVDPKLEAAYPNFGYLMVDHGEPGTGELLSKAALERFGRIDALVWNHGVISPIARLDSIDLNEFRHSMQVNVYSGIEIIQACLSSLRARNGNVVFVSSGASVSGTAGWGAYCTAKHAGNAVIETLAKEETSVKCISLRPGVVDTDMQAQIRAMGHHAMSSEFYQRFVDFKEGGHLLAPDVPAQVIAKLALEIPNDLNGRFVSYDTFE